MFATCRMLMILCAALVAAGCVTIHPDGTTGVIAAASQTDKWPKARMRTAPHAATYTLVHDGLFQPRRTLLSFHLEKGEPLGFERTEDGRIIAVAGEHRYTTTTPTGTYAWVRPANAGDVATDVTIGVLGSSQ